MEGNLIDLAPSGLASAGLRVIAAGGCTLACLERPTEAELTTFLRDFPVHRSDVTAALDRSAPLGSWRQDDYTVVAVAAPFGTPERTSVRIQGSPITLLIGTSFLAVIHFGEIRPLNRWLRQLETDEPIREEAFAEGTEGLALQAFRCLVDAGLLIHSWIERDLAAAEDAVWGERGSEDAALPRLPSLRANVRRARRLVAPWPNLLRSMADERIGWEHLAARSNRLLEFLDDDLSASDGLFLAASVQANARQARLLRALTLTVATALPVLTVATILAIPAGNPLTASPMGFAIALAILGGVFLGALIIVRLSRRLR